MTSVSLDVHFQSVHEPTGPSEGYLQLEELVKQVVSPFLGISEDRGVSGPTFTLGKGPTLELLGASVITLSPVCH